MSPELLRIEQKQSRFNIEENFQGKNLDWILENGRIGEAVANFGGISSSIIPALNNPSSQLAILEIIELYAPDYSKFLKQYFNENNYNDAAILIKNRADYAPEINTRLKLLVKKEEKPKPDFKLLIKNISQQSKIISLAVHFNDGKPLEYSTVMVSVKSRDVFLTQFFPQLLAYGYYGGGTTLDILIHFWKNETGGSFIIVNPDSTEAMRFYNSRGFSKENNWTIQN